MIDQAQETKLKRELREIDEKLDYWRKRYKESNSDNYKRLILESAKVLQGKKADLEKALS